MLHVDPFCPSRIHLPTPLPSDRFCYPVVSRLTPQRYYEGSDSCSARLPGRSLRLLHLACRTSRPQPRRVPECRFVSHLSAFSEFQASPCASRLAASRRRNGFVLLRAILSPPVALHAALGDAVTFVYAGCDFLRQGLAPCCQGVLTDALAPASAPANQVFSPARPALPRFLHVHT